MIKRVAEVRERREREGRMGERCRHGAIGDREGVRGRKRVKEKGRENEGEGERNGERDNESGTERNGESERETHTHRKLGATQHRRRLQTWTPNHGKGIINCS